MAGNFYVIGDVHGCAEELKILLHQLPLDQESTLLFLGDYVDRGPNSRGVIDTVLNISELYKVIALKGNHEWLLEQYLKNPADPAASSNFILNGGSSTLASYSSDGTTYEIPGTHLAFLKSLRYFYTTDTHFFVHAGVPPGYDFFAPNSSTVDPKTAHQMMWIRSTFLECKEKWPKLVVHGHTPVDKPEVLPNRINLDTGCVFGRRLTAMNVTNGKFYSVARDQESDPKFLTSVFEGRPRAHRFVGEIPVEVAHGSGAPFHFKTVNFNEFGLLIFHAPKCPVLPLRVGQKVSGRILPGAGDVFEFSGAVTRVDTSSANLLYAVKFDKLVNQKETI